MKNEFNLYCEPGTAYDLQSDPKWEEVSKYAGGKQIFDGEIGRLSKASK